MIVSMPISPILTIRLVAMARSVKRSKKRVRAVIYDQHLSYGENSVKIGSVDPEIALLKGSLKI